MTKLKKHFVCTECGATSTKWLGRCPSCQAWNSYQEEIVNKQKRRSVRKGDLIAVPLTEIDTAGEKRIPTIDSELNRILGGGVVPGSLILLAGNPGIGKSTLLLQTLLTTSIPSLYASGEESLNQIKMRADRLGISSDNCLIYSGYDLEDILEVISDKKPRLVVIDSIQSMTNADLDALSGSISQIRSITERLQQVAKEHEIAILLIGHITKDGSIAGPKLLEHMVDVVLQFEGDHNNNYRMLRTLKNRFGSTMELGIYEMSSSGLSVVSNPSEILISQGHESLSGSAIAGAVEGVRPLMIETQALVSTSVYATPQRSTTGFDPRRLNMLLAVLEKRGGLPLFKYDVFLNIAGGLRVSDPAMDLSVTAALASSLYDIPVPRLDCFAAEVGLSGEVRSVGFIEKRIQEATRLGFKRIFLSKYHPKDLSFTAKGIQIVKISKINELFEILFAQ